MQAIARKHVLLVGFTSQSLKLSIASATSWDAQTDSFWSGSTCRGAAESQTGVQFCREALTVVWNMTPAWVQWELAGAHLNRGDEQLGEVGAPKGAGAGSLHWQVHHMNLLTRVRVIHSHLRPM